MNRRFSQPCKAPLAAFQDASTSDSGGDHSEPFASVNVGQSEISGNLDNAIECLVRIHPNVGVGVVTGIEKTRNGNREIFAEVRVISAG